MGRHILVLCLTTIWYCLIDCGPVPSNKDVMELRKDQIHSELTKLRQILNKLEKEETLEKNTQQEDINDSKVNQNKGHLENETQDTKDMTNKAKHPETNDQENKPFDEIDRQTYDIDQETNRIDDEMDLAMKNFLGSLSEESLQKLKEMRRLLEKSKSKESETPQDKSESKNKTLKKEHSFETYLEEPVANELDVNWQNIVRELDKQRDQLYLQEHKPQKDADGMKMTTHTQEGVFGKFSDEVKTAVEKNLLSDVALAIHSGVSIDEIIEDILGKEKGDIM